jgi:Alanine dehydrogenase/PNT, N-terminal domain
MGILGIRREDKSRWERRTPLVPRDVARLVESGVTVHVESSPNRCVPDAEFAAAGAVIVEELTGATAILGVKEVPTAKIVPGCTYLFFSHTMKGQSYNMPMLRRLLDAGCTMLDYELVTDEDGLRTIAFGRHAGLAGTIDTLWALGRRFAAEGIDTPLAAMKQALDYHDLDEARRAVREVGSRIGAEGLPEAASPLAIGVTGEGGKVWGGAMEILELLPHRRLAPRELAAWRREAPAGRAREIAIASYGPEHLVEPRDPARTYDWDDYVAHPEHYRARFGRDLAHLTAVVYGIFWTDRYPRFVQREDVAALWADGNTPALRVLTDITCDPGGSNELLVRTTDPGDPAYVVDPDTLAVTPGFEGRGPVIVAVDILPAELPRDASQHFSGALVDLVAHLAKDDPFPAADDPSIPGPLRRSLMVLRGRLVPPWNERLAGPLAKHGGAPQARKESA